MSMTSCEVEGGRPDFTSHTVGFGVSATAVVVGTGAAVGFGAVGMGAATAVGGTAAPWGLDNPLCLLHPGIFGCSPH